MKKTLLLLFVLISITAKGQQTTDNPVASDLVGKSLVVQKMDSTYSNEIANIKSHLTSYYKANRYCQALTFGGLLLDLTGVILMKNSDKAYVLPICGGLCTLAGGIIYLDSFKFLNMNKPKRSKVRTVGRSIDDLYW